MAKKRRSQPFPIDKAIGVAFVVGALIVAGFFIKDKLAHGPAEAKAKAEWPAARALVAARLKQDEPLEFGAVWYTHKGTICGLVNGKGSFGGLTGMTPFYVWRGHAYFPYDVTAVEFAQGWQDCTRDTNWVRILQGSMASGYCATKAGQSRCH